LHLAVLGVPKTPWKHAILNNASDDAREAISELLKQYKHPLDCRRKDDNRSRAQKWFTGERWATFCSGERGSPGGPMAIAAIVLIIAKDMQAQGISGSGVLATTDQPTAITAAPKANKSGKGRSRGAFTRGRAQQKMTDTDARAASRTNPWGRADLHAHRFPTGDHGDARRQGRR